MPIATTRLKTAFWHPEDLPEGLLGWAPLLDRRRRQAGKLRIAGYRGRAARRLAGSPSSRTHVGQEQPLTSVSFRVVCVDISNRRYEMDHLQRITERVSRQGDPDDENTPRPLLSLNEFFDGNECHGSIGCNLPGRPSPQEMYQALKRIADRADVADVRVQISQFDDPDWPFSDQVFVFTSATPEEVLTWFSEVLRPDEAWEGFSPSVRYEAYVVPDGTRPVACWWD